MGNTLRWTSLPSVCLLLLLAGQSRADITCKAVTSDTETNVTCDFGTDLKNSFNVHFFYPDIHAQPDPTLACNRLTSGELTCQYGGGVKFDEKQVGRTITLTGPPAKDKTGGKYVCQSVPPLNVPNEPCTLTYEAPLETGTGDSGNVRDHGHYTLTLVTLILVVLLCAAFVFYVLHKKQVSRKSGCQAPTQDENSTQVMLTPASNTTQERAALAGESSVDAHDHGPKSAVDSIEMHEIEKGKAPQRTANTNVTQFKDMYGNTQAKSDPAPSESEAATPLISPSDGAQASGSAEGRNTLRVMILGQPRSGRSTVGDRLLGRHAFISRNPFASEIRKCQWAEGKVNNVLLQVTDTYFPGDKTDLEMVKSLALTSPGPHVVLMVIRCDQLFTQEHYQQYLRLTGRFGEGIKEYMIVVFTHLDTHGKKRDEQKQNLLQWINADRNKDIVKVINDSDGRYIGFNNEASRQDKKEQVEEILKKMNELKLKHGGGFFQNSYSEGVSQLVTSLVEARMKKKHETQAVAEKTIRESIVRGDGSNDVNSRLLGLVTNKANPRASSSKQT